MGSEKLGNTKGEP
jgi:hypothetical protein